MAAARPKEAPELSVFPGASLSAAASVEWYVPLARAIPSLLLGGAITFMADHSARLGLLAFGLFCATLGGILTVAVLRGADRNFRGARIPQAVIALAVGVAALAVPGGGLAYLVLLVATFAVITGFLELYLGLRGRRVDAAAKDALFVGAVTVLLAVAVLLVPPELAQSFVVDEVVGQLTAAVVVVGLLGAYWVVIGVYLVIAALSLKWGSQPASEQRQGEAPPSMENGV